MKIGIDLGGSHIGIGLIENKNIIAKIEKDITEIEKLNIKENLVKNINTIIQNILEENCVNINTIEAIGMATPGIIQDGSIINAYNLNIDKFEIVKELNKYYDKNIFINNDAKCAAMAEKKYGSLQQYNDCIFLTIGTGIGGACFLQGKMLKPSKYSGFEIGHISIGLNEQKCSCGNTDCFEAYSSIRALKNNIKKELSINTEITGIELLQLIQNNEKRLDLILEEYSVNLAKGLTNLINIFEPEAICLGGSFAYYEDVLLHRVISKIKPFNKLINTKILIAELNNNAGIIGATLF